MRIWIAILATLACATVLHAQQDAGGGISPRDVLRLMEKGNRAEYVGLQSFEMRLGERSVQGTGRVAHLGRSTRTEILTPDRLKGMLILERGGMRMMRRPGDTRWHPGMGTTPPQSRRILRNYTIRTSGPVAIAGNRRALVVEIQARVPNRPWRKLWVDRETGVVLRSELYNWAGRMVSASEFQEIDYSPTLEPGDFEVPSASPDRRPGPGPDSRRMAPPEGEIPKPAYVPQGFDLFGSPRRERPPASAAHLRYTDGLNTISVFVRRTASGEGPWKPGPERRPLGPGGRPPGPEGHPPGSGGRHHALGQPFSNVVQHVKGDYRIIVIGDLDPAELRRMAESVQ